jgi:hypothetical protein
MKESTIKSRYHKRQLEALEARRILSDAHMTDVIQLAFNGATEPPTATLLATDGALSALDDKTIIVALESASKAGDLLKGEVKY